MSGDPLELTEDQAQIHAEWQAEEDDEARRAPPMLIGRPHEQGSATDVLPVELTRAEDQPRTLRQILFTHRALAGATVLEITELMAEVTTYVRTGQHSVANDARAQLEQCRLQDRVFGSDRTSEGGQRAARWAQDNPGLSALLQVVDLTPTEILLAEIAQMAADSLAECTAKGGFVPDPEAGPKWCLTCGMRRHRHPDVDPSFTEEPPA